MTSSGGEGAPWTRHGKPIQVRKVRTNKRGSWGENGGITPPNRRPRSKDSTTNRSQRKRIEEGDGDEGFVKSNKGSPDLELH